MNVIGFIPARSGSTRLRNKNIKLMDGETINFLDYLQSLEIKKI